MALRRAKCVKGVTLIEVMVTVMVVAVMAIGGLSYEYQAARHARIARALTSATRTAQLMLEDWKSTGGSGEYDPASLGLDFAYVPSVGGDLAVPDGLGTTLHSATYSAKIDGFPMLLVLKHKDVDYDAEADVTLRQLSVVVGFAEVGNEAMVRVVTSLGSDVPVTLSTYVRLDGSNG